MLKRTIRVHAEKTGNETILNLIPLLVVSFSFAQFYSYIVYFVFVFFWCSSVN